MNLSNAPTNTITEGSIPKGIFKLALPAMVSMVSIMAFEFVDLFWIGKLGARSHSGRGIYWRRRYQTAFPDLNSAHLPPNSLRILFFHHLELRRCGDLVGDQLIHISERIDVLLVVSAGEMEIEKDRMRKFLPITAKMKLF